MREVPVVAVLVGPGVASNPGLAAVAGCDVVVARGAVVVVAVADGRRDAGPAEYSIDELAVIPATRSRLTKNAVRAPPTRASPKLHTDPLLPASQ